MTKILLLSCVVLVGCMTVPKLDNAGQPVGGTATESVLDPDALVSAAGAVAPFAGPWGLVLTAAAGLIAAVSNKDKEK